MARPSKPLDPSASQEARLGAAIRQRREDLGITQEQLAAAIGFSRPHLALVELGKAHASEDLVRRCDAALGADGAILAIYPEVIAERERRRHLTLVKRAGRGSSPVRPILAVTTDAEPVLGRLPPTDPPNTAQPASHAEVAAFFGSERRLVITMPLRTLGTGRLVLAHEDVEATEGLARFARAAGLDTHIRYVEPTGELDFSPAGLVVICGAKSSPVIARIIADHDPVFTYTPDVAGRMWITQRSTGRALGSPMDEEFPANQDICYVARLPRPGGGRPFLSIGGIHAVGSLGAVHLLTNPHNFRELHRTVGAERFSMATSCAFTRAPLRILTSEVLAPPRPHREVAPA
jgi:transcriptional regulator with XRE-family HTH domain